MNCTDTQCTAEVEGLKQRIRQLAERAEQAEAELERTKNLTMICGMNADQVFDMKTENQELKAEVERLTVYLDHAVIWCDGETPDWLMEYKEWKAQKEASVNESI